MAQEVKVLLICDFAGDKHEATETVRFQSPDHNPVEADVCDKHKAEMVKAFAKFADIGRNVHNAAGTQTRKRPSRPSSGISHAQVRAWAAGQGIEVNPRGNLPKDVIEKWEAAGRPAA
jgi:hypothetical protein